MKSLRAHGWCRDLPKKNNLYKKSNDKFKDHFVFITPGYSLRPLEIEAAIGLVQLRKLKKFMKIRHKNSLVFKNYLAIEPVKFKNNKISPSLLGMVSI